MHGLQDVGLRQHDAPQGEGRVRHLGGHDIPQHPREARQEGQQRLDNTNVHLRRLSAFGVGLAAVLRCLVAIGTLGISEGIRAGIEKAIECYGTKSTPQVPVKVTIPGTGQEVDLDPSILPSRIPKDMTAEDLQRAVQEKIDRGHDLVSQLNGDTHDGSPCTLKDMTDIMFFLQAKSEGAKGSWEAGAFTISDPGNRINNFLNTCTGAYQRDSSHISDFQLLPGGSHRGIDSFGSGKDLDSFLPHGKTTLLFGKLPQSDGLKMPEERLYLKMEPYGAWLFAPKVQNDDGPHRYSSWRDIGAAIGHSLSFLETRGQGSAAGSFKERVPSSVKTSFNEMVETMPREIQEILTEGDPTDKSKGIRFMLANVDLALQEVEAGSDEHTALTEFATKVRQDYDHCGMRFGNEIIFTQQDIG